VGGLERSASSVGAWHVVDGARCDDHVGAMVAHAHAEPSEVFESATIRRQFDGHARTVAVDTEAHAIPVRRESRSEGHGVTVFHHSGESVDDGGPHSTTVRDVDAVGGVLVSIADVEIQRPTEVGVCQIFMTDLG